MQVKKTDNSILLDNNYEKILIYKTIDDDIWFETNKDKSFFEINYSRDCEEIEIYKIFRMLVFEIAGNYTFDEFNLNLPNDFIDNSNKTITWHSDSSKDNVLKIIYDDNKIIIELIKDSSSMQNLPNRVRIRTDGSNYGHYHEYFTKLYNTLSKYTDKDSKQKSKSFIRIFHKK